MITVEEEANYETFRDCLSELIIAKSSNPKGRSRKRTVRGRKNEIKPVQKPVEQEHADDAQDLADFIEYLASEIYSSLDPELRTLSYTSIQNDDGLRERYSLPLDSDVYESITTSLPPSVSDSLTTYSLLPPSVDLSRLLEPVFTSYIEAITTAPPEHAPTTSRGTECEICARDQLPLTYHHLIPRQMHAKAVKRGWVKEWELQKVSWLCRACHSYVHRIASNEELAKEFNEIGKISEREDVQAWAKWISRVRWKAR